jgi:hypothetical protein
MTLPRTVAEVLSEHVSFEVECIDRMYLNVYQPRLQHPAGAAVFFVGHRGYPFASSALMDPMSKGFVAAIDRFCTQRNIPRVDFAKGQRKDDLAHEYLARFEQPEGVLFVGRAQEKTAVFRTERRRNPITGAPYPWIVRSTGVVNHLYVYCVDDDFGPFFIKFCTYFPYTAKLCINGHEWAKRQATKAGIGFTALDNGFAAVDDIAAVQSICEQLSAEHIDALLRKWLAILPHPFTPADRAAGYRYDISILQAEFSLTQMLDRPVSGRVFFDEVIRENLDLGRPDRVGLVFNRRIHTKGRNTTPGRFRTRVITDGVTPSLHIDYKQSKIKQYHKEGRALRTETTINDTRDFAIGKRLINLPALREVGFTANRRLLRAQHLSHDPILGDDAFTAITAAVTAGSQRIPGFRFDHPRTQALLSALTVFRLLPRGFTNADLRTHLAPLLNPQNLSPGAMTYDLRRLRQHGLIHRIPGSHRYHVSDLGWRTAQLFTRTYTRLLRPGLAHLMTTDPVTTPTIRRRIDQLQTAFDDYARHANLIT